MTLINYIREYQSEGRTIENAVDKAVLRCIDEDILKQFLEKHRAEVMDVCITEYNEKTFISGIRAEGFDEGVEKTRIEAIQNMLKYNVSEEDILKDYTKGELNTAKKMLSENKEPSVLTV